MRKLPHEREAGYKLLQTMLAGPGTFYQICERAEFDIESDRAENILREVFAQMLDGGHAYLSGVTYTISSAARAALAPPAPYVGQVAGPAYRGTPTLLPARVVRASGALA